MARILFVHNNFPAQFIHLAPALAQRGHVVHALGSRSARDVAGVQLHRYGLQRGSTPGLFAPATRYEADCLRGAAAADVARAIAADGFSPDLIIGHLGWGETLFLKDVWPTAKLAVFAEFNTRARGLDVDFDPEFAATDFQETMRVTAKAGSVLLALTQADFAFAPTQFQADSFPAPLRSKIVVSHEGVDCGAFAPSREIALSISDKARTFRSGDPIVTYVNRHLEPMRGLHIFLRALPTVFARCPDAQVVIVGAPSATPYGRAPPAGKTWYELLSAPLAGQLDRARLHVLGRLDRDRYRAVLGVSAAHVYLTYPFVVSWSLLEAMAAECLIIGSDTAPVREALRHGHNGLMVDFFDHGQLAETMVQALQKPEAFRHLRHQARQDAIAQFDVQTVCLPQQIAMVQHWLGGSA